MSFLCHVRADRRVIPLSGTVVPDALAERFGESAYERRHGAGTASGDIRMIADRWAPWQAGDVVSVERWTIVRDAHGRSVAYVTGTVDRAATDAYAAQIAADQHRATARAAALDDIARDLMRVDTARGALRDLPANQMQALFDSTKYGRKLSVAAMLPDLETVCLRSLRCVAEILTAEHPPTLSFRNIPRDWMK